jgi:hypothetical protein
MGAAIEQVQAKWTTHGNIARLESALERETNEGRRSWLEGLLKEQRELAGTYEV